MMIINLPCNFGKKLEVTSLMFHQKKIGWLRGIERGCNFIKIPYDLIFLKNTNDLRSIFSIRDTDLERIAINTFGEPSVQYETPFAFSGPKVPIFHFNLKGKEFYCSHIKYDSKHNLFIYDFFDGLIHKAFVTQKWITPDMNPESIIYKPFPYDKEIGDIKFD